MDSHTSAAQTVVTRTPDASGQVLAEQALRLSERNYRLLIEEAPYAVCRATASGQLLQVNASMLAMLRYGAAQQSDLLMRDLPQIFVERSGFERFTEALKSADAVQGFDSAWYCHDGEQIQVRIGGRRERGAAGETLCFDLWAEDVTERKNLEARLAQAEKMQAIGKLAGGIAHDFNNLLTVINGYCELLLRDERAGVKRDSLEMIYQAGERASELTQQLLTFSRKQVTRAEAVSLNEIVSEVVRLSRRLIGENIEIVAEYCAGGDIVLAEPAQIHQVVMNLVINARDAMPQGGELRIGTSLCDVKTELAGHLDVPAASYVVLTVRDNGVGMDSYVKAHIFEPFFTTKEVGKGTGLGLSTVYGTVQQNKGAVTVESSAGAGTTFRIYLPQVAEAAEMREPVAVTRPRPGLAAEAATVLVVEDEDAVRRLEAELLRSAGFHVIEAANGDEAIGVAAQHTGAIHLLVTDMVMPGMGGDQLARRVRALHPEVKVLVVSGYSDAFDVVEGFDRSGGYLAKPFTVQQLIDAVKQSLKSASR